MKTSNQNKTGLKIVTGVKAGGLGINHNRRVTKLSVKTGIKAGEGILTGNHSRRAR